MPLLLCVIFIGAFAVTESEITLYTAIVFAAMTFIADWIGRYINRKTPPPPAPGVPNFKNEVVDYINGLQRQGLELLENGKTASASHVINKNAEIIDQALKVFPDEPTLHALKGYTFKDLYQSSRGALPKSRRIRYLEAARKAFERSLELDPEDPGARNGIGNVLLFEGRLDEAEQEIKKALELTGGNYEAAAHDLRLVNMVQEGVIPLSKLS